MIGVDIGVPARRIKTDPAAQTRSAVIGIVAAGAIIAVVLLAFLISNLGSNETPAGTEVGTATPTRPGGANTAETPAASGIPGVERGLVPALEGQTAERAKLAIAEAGYRADERSEKSGTFEKGVVLTQSPAPGIVWPEGSSVTIVVSEGP